MYSYRAQLRPRPSMTNHDNSPNIHEENSVLANNGITMQKDSMTPRDFRLAIRRREHITPTAGFCPGHVQVNLVILPREEASEFLLFCQRNPRPLPLLEVVEAGEVEARVFAPGSDVRTDCPKYVLLRDGVTSEITDLCEVWRDDLVTFMLGCSFSFEAALLSGGVPVRHIEMGCNVPMFRTNIAMNPAGRFHGPMVVTMRPIPAGQVSKAVMASGRFPGVHGAPLHVGYPEGLGITDLNAPDYGDPVRIDEGEIPVFWACGVSGLSAVTSSKVPFAITHAPGHMLVCDTRDEDLAVF